MTTSSDSRSLRLVGCTLVASALLALAAPARADDVAEALYQEGRVAAQAKNWDLACAKLGASHEREPAPGTLLNLADCHEHLGKLATAQAEFAAVTRLFKPTDPRAGVARDRAAALEKRAPHLILRLQASAPAETSIVENGKPLDSALLGKSRAIDPGEHVLVVSAPGRVGQRVAVQLAEGETREIELAAGAPVAAPVLAPAAAAKTAPREDSSVPPSAPSSFPFRTVGFVGLGVGVAGVAVGTVAGLLTLSAKNNTDANCVATGCNPDGLAAESSGKTWSNVSSAAFVVGGVGLVTGAVMLIVAPSRSPRSAVGIAPTRAGSGAVVDWSCSF
jgi:hypothetical protein